MTNIYCPLCGAKHTELPSVEEADGFRINCDECNFAVWIEDIYERGGGQ